MVAHRRNFVSGGTYFFTVTLRNRHARTLVEHVDLLRHALRVRNGWLTVDWGVAPECLENADFGEPR